MLTTEAERTIRRQLANLLEDLHASEINDEIGWFFDGVWCTKIGDRHNGIEAEENTTRSLAEAAEWLRSKAIELYPKSDFAKKWRLRKT